MELTHIIIVVAAFLIGARMHWDDDEETSTGKAVINAVLGGGFWAGVVALLIVFL